MRVFERALRRAGLPVAMSEGYHPRPKLSLPAPLAVGYAGHNEVADFALSEWTRPAQFLTRLQSECPDGLTLLSAETTAIHPNRQPAELSYVVPLLPGHPLTAERIGLLLSEPSAFVTRQRGREERRVDVRRFIKALRIEGGSLLMLIACLPEGTARPGEVMEALGCREGEHYLKGSIERVNVNLPS
jgi:radical SAM-linked protein